MQIDGAVRKLENMRNDAKSLTIRTLRDVGKAKDDPTPRLNTLLEQFLIEPVSMDPAGIVNKFDHLLDVREAKFKSDVARIAPEANPATSKQPRKPRRSNLGSELHVQDRSALVLAG